MITKSISHFSSSSWFKVALLLCACAAMLRFGIINAGHSGGFTQTNFDTKYLYVAGLSWLNGLNAYDPQVVSQLSAGFIRGEDGGFFYPPQIAPLCLLLAAFPWAKAQVVMTLLNVFCAGVVAFFCVRLVKRTEVKILKDPSLNPWWFIPAIVIGNPFTIHTIRMGQTTLIIAAALVSGWYYARRGQWLIAGILIAISTIKPQLSLLIILWLLLERRWRLLGIAAGTTLLFCLVPMAISGPTEVFSDWFASLAAHEKVSANVVGNKYLFGIQNLLYVAGIDVPNLLPLAILLTLVLWYYRSQLIVDDILGILLAILLLFGVAHIYDLAVLAPLVVGFWRHVRNRKGATIVAICLMLAMFFPQSLLIPFRINLLLQFRVPLLLGSLIWLLVMSFKRAAEFKLLFKTVT